MLVPPERQLPSSEAAAEIRNLARASGTKLMQEYALEKVRQGLTTLEEVQRVVPFEVLSASPCTSCGWELLPAFRFCPNCGLKISAARHSLIKEGAWQT